MDSATPHAEDFIIQMIGANELIAVLDGSADCKDMSQFDALLARKYDECSELYLLDVELMGIEWPICVLIEKDGSWFMGDGHHRLAVASRWNMEVMVLFSTDGNYIRHGICSDEQMTRLHCDVDPIEFYGDDLATI